MAESHHESVIAAGVSIGIIAIFTVPVLLSLARRLGFTKEKYEPLSDDLYEDEDGRASEESQEKFSSWIPRSITLLAASLGLVGQITNGAYLIAESNLPFEDVLEAWLRVGAWVCKPGARSTLLICSRL